MIEMRHPDGSVEPVFSIPSRESVALFRAGKKLTAIKRYRAESRDLTGHDPGLKHARESLEGMSEHAPW